MRTKRLGFRNCTGSWLYKKIVLIFLTLVFQLNQNCIWLHQLHKKEKEHFSTLLCSCLPTLLYLQWSCWHWPWGASCWPCGPGQEKTSPRDRKPLIETAAERVRGRARRSWHKEEEKVRTLSQFMYPLKSQAIDILAFTDKPGSQWQCEFAYLVFPHVRHSSRCHRFPSCPIQLMASSNLTFKFSYSWSGLEDRVDTLVCLDVVV